ncbi:MAG: hypothetical protein RIS88_2518 [Pseudomonadota bacterium]|jgi:hypothetical protein
MSGCRLRAGSAPRGTLRGRGLLSCLGLLLWAGLGSAAWALGSDCAFRTGGGLVLGFGILDPSAARGVQQQQAVAPRRDDLEAGDCAPGFRMRIQVEGGQHDLGGQLRMKHTTRPDAFLRYAVQVEPSTQQGPGKRRYVGFDLLGRLDAADIATARGGVYQDTLRVSVFP